jgi:hypothetical protein
MRYIPTEKQLKAKVKLVQISVKGEYMAAIDERRKVSRRYKVDVLVPENFTKSDIKRQTPRVLAEHKDYGDFVFMRTFFQDGPAKKTDKTKVLADLYSDRELARFGKFRKEAAIDAKKENAARGDIDKGKPGDVSEIDPDTGLPPVINDGPEDEDGDEE